MKLRESTKDEKLSLPKMLRNEKTAIHEHLRENGFKFEKCNPRKKPKLCIDIFMIK